MSVRLSDLAPGRSAVVVAVASRARSRLARLTVLGVVPGRRLTLQQVRPAFVLRIGFSEISVERGIAEEILVAPD
ncbi:MAG: ferrous iron transport protein A [Acidobacteria bacterium]|nr:ferrous iron transport protein A [Acidobacteriota bacterium]